MIIIIIITITIIIQLFIIYVPSQQPQGQLQPRHSVDTGQTQHKVESNHKRVLEQKHNNEENQTNKSKQMMMIGNNNYITQNIRIANK
jgi:hypothetical protein